MQGSEKSQSAALCFTPPKCKTVQAGKRVGEEDEEEEERRKVEEGEEEETEEVFADDDDDEGTTRSSFC